MIFFAMASPLCHTQRMAGFKYAEAAVQVMLWNWVGRNSKMMIPNYTPSDWWEADVWRCMQSGMTAEYEIKLSASDFKADGKKSKWTGPFRGKTEIFKHELLAKGTASGPNRFFYVTPLDLDVEIPEWAGHLVVTRAIEDLRDDRVRGCLRWSNMVRTRKQAPVLHRDKAKLEVAPVATTLMHRYWNEKRRHLHSRLSA